MSIAHIKGKALFKCPVHFTSYFTIQVEAMKKAAKISSSVKCT